MATTVADIVQILETVAPPALAEAWDNVGLMVGDPGQEKVARVAVVDEVAPGLFSVDGSGAGQGLVLHAGTTEVAMVRNYRYAGRPAVAVRMMTPPPFSGTASRAMARRFFKFLSASAGRLLRRRISSR